MAPKKVTNDEKPNRKIIMTTVELKKELITNLLIQFTLFLMGKFNSKVEPPLGTDCVRLSRVHCICKRFVICRSGYGSCSGLILRL
jgi:hypothetical protein